MEKAKNWWNFTASCYQGIESKLVKFMFATVLLSKMNFCLLMDSLTWFRMSYAECHWECVAKID